ncbi:MAG: hypothetical protein RLZZ200_1549 [Pseudomonadota bacterium]|jgi:type 1 glutamine amidotransferase
MKRLLLVTAALACALGGPVHAASVTDCPLRDAPFSADSPLVDILLNPTARALLEAENHVDFSKGPPRFTGTTPPTFAAILTLRTAERLTHLKPESLGPLDAKLRAIPVTAADRTARCARYDNDLPRFDLPAGKPRILLFEKINGFRDDPSVNAARAALVAMAERKGWALAVTDKAGAFNSRTLRQFDAVIWNNISGDALTLSQRRAFQAYMRKGGGFVGLHGSAGDFAYFWDWYADTLIGARFIGHPGSPQFQDARVVVEAKGHPITASLPADWTMKDEWYSFATSPRLSGANVIATLDESTYQPDDPKEPGLRMGDHPIAWTRCVGRGRMFYSAIGHMPETYSQPQNVALMEGGIDWALKERRACPTGK